MRRRYPFLPDSDRSRELLTRGTNVLADIIGRKYSDISTGENTMSHLDQAAALATVDKTPEQREAERQQKLRTEKLAKLAAKLAGWAEQAAKLAKADPSKCQTLVYRRGNWCGHSCSKTAKYHREESLQTYPVDAEAPIVTRHY